jgi:hypothetical protein
LIFFKKIYAMILMGYVVSKCSKSDFLGSRNRCDAKVGEID